MEIRNVYTYLWIKVGSIIATISYFNLALQQFLIIFTL